MTTLHVIGNGFDLCHGIKSSYADFRDFASKRKDSDWVYKFENCYRDINLKTGGLRLWCDLEQTLPNLDFHIAFGEGTEDVEREEGHEIRFVPQMEDSARNYLTDLFYAFHEAFNAWIDSIDISSNMAKSIPFFDEKGVFLSFNYTETLEYLYHIPREKINYIHGRRGTGDKLIVGHNKYVDYSEHLPPDPEIYVMEGYREMADVINEERKKISSVFDNNNCLWRSLQGIDNIVIYGHSLNEIDRPYFKEITENIDSRTKWHISIFYRGEGEKQQEIERVQNFCESLRVLNYDTFQMNKFEDQPTIAFPSQINEPSGYE